MRFWSRAMVGWMIISLIFVYLVDLFTIKPNVISGNGNLGLLFVVPALVVFILLLRSLWKVLGTLNLQSITWRKIGSVALVLLLSFCFLEYKFVINLINNLGGTPEIPDSRIYRYPWLNQYTNTIFVNVYTLGILVSGVTFLKIIIKKIASLSNNWSDDFK